MSASKPLHGVRVAVTRPRERAAELAKRLHELDADVRFYPLIQVMQPLDPRPLAQAAASVSRYHWVVFTSASAVLAFARAAPNVGALAVPSVRIAAVGPATAAAAASFGWSVHALPEATVAASIPARMLDEGPLVNARVLWPRAANAHRALAEALRAAGARLDEVEAYRTVADHEKAEALAADTRSGGIDVLTLTSPSAVNAYRRAGGSQAPGMCVAAIGPVTAAAARAAGLAVHAEASTASMDALVDAVVRAHGTSIAS